jgi:hypothetical protein
MRAKGWDGSNAANPKAWEAFIPATGYSNFTIIFDQRAENNAPNNFALQYSTDNGDNWITAHQYAIRNAGDSNEFKTFEYNIDIGPVPSNLHIRWLNVGTRNFANANQQPNAMSFLRHVVVTGQI